MSTLYLSTALNAPNPRRVSIYLSERGIDFKDMNIKLLDMTKLEHKDEELGNLNKKVPFIKLEDGTVICESMAICRYIESERKEEKQSIFLFGRNSKEIGLVEMWIRMIDIEYMLSAVGPAWINSPLLSKLTGKKVNQKVRDNGVSASDAFHMRLNDQLSKTTWLCGDSYTAADISAFCIMDFALTLVELKLNNELTFVNDWYKKCKERKSANSHRVLRVNSKDTSKL